MGEYLDTAHPYSAIRNEHSIPPGSPMSTSDTYQDTGSATSGSDPPEGLAQGLAASSGNYSVKLHAFEGPLDLLLHLIRQNEVEITDIPVAQIATQYLHYLEFMRDLDLDIAAEYLVMAATLAHIKSRMLLPPSDEEGLEDEIDPRAELIARLLDYQRYKEVADALSKRRWLGRSKTLPALAPDRRTRTARQVAES